MADASGAISLLGAAISAGAAVVTVVLSRRAADRDRRLAAADLALRYREPLLHAAFNLQSRLYNIGRPTGQPFLERFLIDGSPAEQEYARLNTVYLIGQYLCWSEILRRETQFIDPEDRRRERQVMNYMENIREVFSTSFEFNERTLRTFRGEQRAIGEVMLTKSDYPSDRVGPRSDCIGYAAFVKAMESDENVRRWFGSLMSDMDTLANALDGHRARLTVLQNALLDLINLLNPDGDRVTPQLRDRLP